MGKDFAPEESGSSKGGDVEHAHNVGNSEGTLFQSKLGFKPAAKHLLSRPDPVYAEAVHRDAANVEYTLEEEVSFCFLGVDVFLVRVKCGWLTVICFK